MAPAELNSQRVPKKHQAAKFSRTVEAAQRALQEDGTAASWHLSPAPRGEDGLGRRLLDWATLRLWRTGRRSLAISWDTGESQTTRQPFNAITYCGTRAAAQETASIGTFAWSVDDEEQPVPVDGSVLAAVGPEEPARSYANLLPNGAGECEIHPPLPPHRAPVPVAPGARPLPAWVGLARMRRPPLAAARQNLTAFLDGAEPARSFQPELFRAACNGADALPSFLRPDAAADSGPTRSNLTSLAALGALLGSAIVGILGGLSLAVSASGPLPTLQGLWPTTAGLGEQVHPLAAAGVQPLPEEDQTSPLVAHVQNNGEASHSGTGPSADAPAVPQPADSQAPPEPSGPWDIFYERAHELQHQGEISAAADLFREAARLNPAHPAILYDWGYALQLQGRRQEAIEKYRQAMQLDPNHPYAHYNLGFLLQQEGDEAGALASYQRSNEIRPDNPFLHFNWGRILENRGELARAAEHYRRAANLAPNSRPGMDARRRLAQIEAEE